MAHMAAFGGRVFCQAALRNRSPRQRVELPGKRGLLAHFAFHGYTPALNIAPLVLRKKS